MKKKNKIVALEDIISLYKDYINDCEEELVRKNITIASLSSTYTKRLTVANNEINRLNKIINCYLEMIDK